MKPTSEQLTETTSDPASAGADAGPPLRLAVIVASVRKQRQGRVLADWVTEVVADTGAVVDVIDLADCALPDDQLLQPGGGLRSEIAERLAAADGFVVVTPEYNHSYPASLKRAIDWHYVEWQFKAATVVCYGVQGGLLAAEHLRSVFAELSVVTTRRLVGLRAPWGDVDEGRYQPDPGVAQAVAAAVDELVWWAQTLRPARLERPYRP